MQNWAGNKIFCKSWSWKWSFRLACKLYYLQFGFQKYRSCHSQMYFRLQHGCFLVKFPKFQRTPFSTEHFRWLLLEISHDPSLYCIWERWMASFRGTYWLSCACFILLGVFRFFLFLSFFLIFCCEFYFFLVLRKICQYLK